MNNAATTETKTAKEGKNMDDAARVTNKNTGKGEVVYLICTNFATDRTDTSRATAEYMTVISRVVDSCGKSRMTFAERGNDIVYGKTAWGDEGHYNEYFRTREGAYDVLNQLAEEQRGYCSSVPIYVIRGEFTDADYIKDICADGRVQRGAAELIARESMLNT